MENHKGCNCCSQIAHEIYRCRLFWPVSIWSHSNFCDTCTTRLRCKITKYNLFFAKFPAFGLLGYDIAIFVASIVITVVCLHFIPSYDPFHKILLKSKGNSYRHRGNDSWFSLLPTSRIDLLQCIISIFERLFTGVYTTVTSVLVHLPTALFKFLWKWNHNRQVGIHRPDLWTNNNYHSLASAPCITLYLSFNVQNDTLCKPSPTQMHLLYNFNYPMRSFHSIIT